MMKNPPPERNKKTKKETSPTIIHREFVSYQHDIDNNGPIEIQRDLAKKQEDEAPGLTMRRDISGCHEQWRRREQPHAAYERIAVGIAIAEGVAEEAAKGKAHDARQHGHHAKGK